MRLGLHIQVADRDDVLSDEAARGLVSQTPLLNGQPAVVVSARGLGGGWAEVVLEVDGDIPGLAPTHHQYSIEPDPSQRNLMHGLSS